jgi:hypothetical protein
VPLIAQLSNRQFGTELDNFVNALAATMPVWVRAAALCRCGCGREVAAGRKFVNQGALQHVAKPRAVRWAASTSVTSIITSTSCGQLALPAPLEALQNTR